MFTLSDENYQDIPIEFLHFPGGEEHIRITSKGFPRSCLICVDLYSSEDVMKLLLLVDAVRRLYSDIPLELVCPYLPYARQDRVANRGEALSLKVICDLINSCNFKEVKLWDVHSDVALSLLNNVTNITADCWTNQLVRKHHVLIAPDAGAVKKIHNCIKMYNNKVVIAEKTRDTKTGVISGVKVWDNSLMHKHLFIIDDICDGGSTFAQLATELRKQNPERIDLYVTHGIFSKGLGIFKGLIDTVYCPNIWPTVSFFDTYNHTPTLVKL